jgi:hypothetical protein
MHIVPQVDPYRTAAMASAGLAALFAMPRGGAGSDEAGQRGIVNACGEADYKDIVTGVDALIAQGIAEDRIAASKRLMLALWGRGNTSARGFGQALQRAR